MNWAYIAGFFDGEGCVHYLPKNSQYILAVSQCVNHDSNVLLDIKNFLKKNGINSALYMHKQYKVNPKHRRVLCLRIYNASNINKFCRKVVKFSTVKKAKINQALNFTDQVLKRIKERKKSLESRMDKAVRDYTMGHSLNHINARYGLALKTLRKYIRLRGIKIRGRQEAIDSFWVNVGKY